MPRRLLALAALLAASCGPRFSSRAQVEPETLRWAIPFELTTLDPATASEGRAFEVLRQVYEGLVSIDEQGRVVPALAQRWDVEEGGKAYVFHLRKSLKFSDGRPLTALDIAASFERALHPTMRSPLASLYLGDIAGASDLLAGRTTRLSGVEVLDSETVRIRLTDARPSFLAKLAYPACGIVPRDSEEIRDAAHMVGAGPFRATERSTTGMRLVANPYYWGGKPSLSGIEIRFVIDATTRANLFRVGSVDLASVAGTDVAGIKRDPKLSKCLVLTPRADVSYLQFNATTFPTLRDPRVRRALALCIDRRRLAEEILGGVPKAASTLIPPGVPGHIDAPPAGPRPDEARKLLTAAGFPTGKGFPALQLVYQETQRDNPAAEAIVTSWRKELGIEATAHAVPAAALRELNGAHRIPCFLTAWVGDYPDPDDYIPTLLKTGSDANGSGYSDRAVDRLLAEADSESGGRRVGRYAQAEALALKAAPIVPLLFLTDAELVAPRVHHIPRSAFGHLSLKSVSTGK